MALQWGRRRSSTKTCSRGSRPPPQQSFNGVVDARRRRPERGRADDPTSRGFNGVVDARRRRRGSTRSSAWATALLQWGRRRSSTKTRSPGARRRRRAASMGSSTLVDEDAAAAAPLPQRPLASMGSSTLVDEDIPPATMRGPIGRQQASMGSSTLVDEDTSAGRADDPLPAASMGSSTLVDEDAVRRGRSARATRCFNGVVDARRRRRDARGARRRPPCGFNGVVDARRRRRGRAAPLPSTWRWLQWGRRRSSTKTRRRSRGPTCRLAASMGSSTLVDEDRQAGVRGCAASPAGFNGVVDARRRRLDDRFLGTEGG